MDVPDDETWVVSDLVEADSEDARVCRREANSVARTRIPRGKRDSRAVAGML